MNKDLIEQAFNAVIAKEKCYVRTGFHQLDTAFSKYSEGSLF